jgi:hypothetical protein
MVPPKQILLSLNDSAYKPCKRKTLTARSHVHPGFFQNSFALYAISLHRDDAPSHKHAAHWIRWMEISSLSGLSCYVHFCSELDILLWDSRF